MMEPFEVLVLGVGDTFSERHHTASLLLSAGGVRVAVDCPDRYREALGSASARAGRSVALEEVDHVLITHIHGDHVNGLEGVAFYRHFVEGRRLSLLAAPEVRAALWPGRLEAPMATLWDGQRFVRRSFEDYFEHTALTWEAPVQVGPFRITARRTVHHVPTSALLVEAGGRTLGYSADTAFDPELIRALSAADLIIHETNFGPAHTPYERLAELPAALRAKMRLIHYHDGFDVEGSVIRCLAEGEVLVV